MFTPEVGLGAAIAAGGPIGGGHAIAGPNLSLDGDLTVLANTTVDVHADAFAAQAGVLANGLSVDQQTQRQLKRLSVLTGLDPILFPFLDPNPPLQASFNPITDVDPTADTIKIATPHEFDTGDAVVYRNNEDDTNVGDLVNKQTFFISVGANPAIIQLHATRADALAGINAIDLDTVPNFEDRHTLTAERTFDPNAAGIVDESAGNETINVGNLAGLADGDGIKYFDGGANNIGGLENGVLYFANVDDSDLNNIKVRLFKSRTAALLNTDPIDLTLAGVTGTEHRLVKVVDAYQPAQATIDPRLDVNGDDNHIRIDASRMGVTTGDTIVYGNNGDDETIGDVVDGGTYYVHVYTDAQDHPISMTLHTTRADALTVPAFGFNPDNPAIDDGPANTIKLGGSNSGFSTGDKVTYATGGGAPIGGLTDGGVYFLRIIPQGPNFFASFFNTAHDAANNTNAIALNIPPATGNPHTITSLNGQMSLT